MIERIAIVWLAVAVLPMAAEPTFQQFMGINGHFTFKPELYAPVVGKVRNYHNLNWDVKKPGDPLTIPVCANKVNWDKHVYGKWRQHDLEISACVQFASFGRENPNYQALWQGQDEWTRQYGRELARYFGPGGKNQCTSIEIGNEPGKGFDDALYRKLFRQMATGIREGDPKIKIVTCTVQPGPADTYSKNLTETFGAPDMQPLYDVINLHVYAVLPKRKGRSPWDRSYPEDPQLDYLTIVDETIAWRNKHAPGKEIWITEFGYDACTDEVMDQRQGWFKKLNWTDVTDLQQAQYLVRSFLCFAERDVDRAYLYFYDDKNQPSVHAASGLTRNFKPKPSYWAVKQLYEQLGEYRFKRVVEQLPGDRYVYEFVHSGDAAKIKWVAWSPTGSGRTATVALKNLPAPPKRILTMATTKDPVVPMKPKLTTTNALQIELSESPVYLEFQQQGQ